MKKMKKPMRILLSVIIGTLLTAIFYYIVLPPINIYSPNFWTFLLLVVLYYGVPLILLRVVGPGEKTVTDKKTNMPKTASPFATFMSTFGGKILVAVAVLPLVVLFLGNIFSSTFFNARRYASVIEVQDGEFSKDMPETNTVTNISLMDTSSASILGNRALGALSDVVSQYDLSMDYNQINYQGSPRKVSNLEYVEFFRWFNNYRNGVPGYVMVDPVNSKAEYIKLKNPLIYVESAYFNQDLMRKLRFSYPTKIFSIEHSNFELDDNGNPFYIVSCYAPKIGLFGAMDVNEVILFNPCDGSSEIYPVEDCPTWVDNVYDGDLACQKYNWYGNLSGGYWNSVISHKGCKQTTRDFGYIVLDDDVWYFTGVTSVTSDQSNIGFILTNARTGEYKYYPVIGSDEYSAMGAAEGEVQEKGYRASFPSLINVSGEATYIMVLKDANGLVKLYALVNVENYSIVATGDTQTEAKTAYLELLMRNGIVDSGHTVLPGSSEATLTVREVRLATVNGESIVYITGDDGAVYKSALSTDETLMLISVGDRLKIQYGTTSHEKVRVIMSWEMLPAA